MSGTLSPVPDRHGGGEESVLMVLAANYRDLDMDGAGRLHESSPQIARHLLARNGPVAGCVVLSTCNRFEIYCDVRFASEVDGACLDALGSISECTDLPLHGIRVMFDMEYGPAVTEHLFAVGTGLDSLVIGEREIAGQVRRALVSAQAHGTVSGRLCRLFQAAARTAKDLSARVQLGDAGSSAAAVALDLATEALRPASLAVKPAVLIGSGIYAGTMVSLLRKHGCSDISVFSRSGRAGAFAAAREVTAIRAEELPSALARAHLLIGCSGIGARLSLSTVAASRQDSSHVLVAADLAPSHDFDPRIAEVPRVKLITLESVRQAAPRADFLEVQRARALVRQAAESFEEQEALRAVDNAIVALRRHVEQILDSEMKRVRKVPGRTAPAEETSASLRRVVNRLLHVPAVRARELAAAGKKEEYTAALEALFGIRVEPIGHPQTPRDKTAPSRAVPDRWEDGWEDSATA